MTRAEYDALVARLAGDGAPNTSGASTTSTTTTTPEANTTSTSSGASAIDADVVAQRVLAQLAERQALQTAEVELRAKYPSAVDADLTGAQTREEIETRLAERHTAVEAQRAALRQEVEADVRAQYAKAHGRLPAAPPADTPTPGGLTAADLARMSLAEMKKHGVTDADFNRILGLG